MEATKFPEKVGKENIKLTPPLPGGTAIVVQRHGRYITERTDEKAGSLTDEALIDVRQQGETEFGEMLSQLTPEEQQSVDVLVIASDTAFFDKGQRSMETARVATEGIEAALTQHGLVPDEHELNGKGGPRPTKNIREPNIFPEFSDLLEANYPGKMFWAYETGKMADERRKMGKESTEEIGDRLANFIDVLARYSQAYHSKHVDKDGKPNRRLIVWVATHYDTISPYVKNHLTSRVDPEWFLPVDYGGGFVVNISPSGEAKTEIEGVEYPVPVKTTRLSK
jgi:hypothetical protein